MRVCVSIILYVCVYEIRLIAREKRTTILYAILRPSSRIVAIIIIIIIYNWTAAECSRRKEFSTRFCPIYTYTYKYTRVCARASTNRPYCICTVIILYTLAVRPSEDFVISRIHNRWFSCLFFPYMYISSVYYYYYHYILFLPLPPPPSKVICHNVRRRVAAVGCSEIAVAVISPPWWFRGRVPIDYY